MQLLTSILLVLSFAVEAQTIQDANQLFSKRGESNAKALKAISAYEKLLKTEKLNVNKCFYYNQIGYLNFFIGTRESNNSSESKYLEKTMAATNNCLKLFNGSVNASDYSSLANNEKEQVALAAYHYGTALARSSEIKGDFAVITNWGKIKGAMEFIIRMGQKDTYYYGAYRTLAIAYGKMPKLVGGDKVKAEKFFKLAINKTLWSGRTISYYVFNSLSLAELYHAQKKKTDACSIINEVLGLKDAEIKAENAELYYEVLSDQNRAKKMKKSYGC